MNPSRAGAWAASYAVVGEKLRGTKIHAARFPRCPSHTIEAMSQYSLFFPIPTPACVSCLRADMTSVQTDNPHAAAGIAAAIASAKTQHASSHTAMYVRGHLADTMDIPSDAPCNVFGALNHAEDVSAAMDAFVDAALEACRPNARDTCGVQIVHNICIVVELHE